MDLRKKRKKEKKGGEEKVEGREENMESFVRKSKGLLPMNLPNPKGESFDAEGIEGKGRKSKHSIYERGIRLEIVNTDKNVVGGWRIKIIDYLEDPNRQVPYRVKAQSHNFILMEWELQINGLDELLLRCLSFLDNMEVIKQVHEGFMEPIILG